MVLPFKNDHHTMFVLLISNPNNKLKVTWLNGTPISALMGSSLMLYAQEDILYYHCPDLCLMKRNIAKCVSDISIH